jgi:SsrA-binding protein
MSEINIRNKKASFEYEFLETSTAGMVLLGTEIKSIREGKASIAESYCTIEGGEAWILNMTIQPYENASFRNHEPKRKRKLLMAKKEISKWENKLKDKGLTIIATKVFINKKGWAKINLALARGKKLHDKRQTIKDKDMKRDMARIKKIRI